MGRRGQLTIFVIVALIVAVVLIAVIYMLNSENADESSKEYFESESVKMKVNSFKRDTEDCIDNAADQALILIPFQGGYYKAPERSFSYSPVFFPYYYYEGKVNVPTIEMIEKNMGEYVSDSVVDCIRQKGEDDFKFDFEMATTDVRITKGNVYFQVDMPIELRREGNMMMYNTKEHELNYNSTIYEMHEVAKYYSQTHKEDPEYYCISCVSEMAHERGLNVYLFPPLADQLITGVMIYENKTGTADPSTYMFFNKYTGEEKSPDLDF